MSGQSPMSPRTNLKLHSTASEVVTMTPHRPWLSRVAQYVDHLDACVEELNDALDETRMGATRRDALEVERSTDRLSNCLIRLESLIAARQALIEADDAPTSGSSLREMVASVPGNDAAQLGLRCAAVARDVDLSRERAVALFVCQYHLTDLTREISLLLRGGETQRFYEDASQSERRPSGGGTLFNKAA